MPVTTLHGEAIDAHVREMLEGREPAFLGRIGGSDTNLAVGLTAVPELFPWQIAQLVVRLKAYNGYYDTREQPDGIRRFSDLLTDCYRSCSLMSAGHRNFLGAFFPDLVGGSGPDPVAVSRSAQYVHEHVADQGTVRLFAYNYIEGLLAGPHTLFKLFGDVLPGKRVVVVSPFSRTIESQWPARESFFPGYRYPDFELLTYNTPITYAGLPPEAYPDQDWFGTLERIQAELSRLDFDIALLACGGYATPLGCYIRDGMNKKAVYVGGVLQMYFGVLGRRFESSFYQKQVNPSVFVRPQEGLALAEQLKLGDSEPTEAFGAYF